jgi:hypothetical protein
MPKMIWKVKITVEFNTDYESVADDIRKFLREELGGHARVENHEIVEFAVKKESGDDS